MYIKKIDWSDNKSKKLLVIIKNIVKQKNSLYSSFTSRQHICNRFQKENKII